MSLSKVYSVKSNAARAAKGYGIERSALIEVPGGWAFEMPGVGTLLPSGQSAPEAHTEPVTAPAPEVPAVVETATSEAAPEPATVPKGWDVVEPGPEQGVGTPEPAEPEV